MPNRPIDDGIKIQALSYLSVGLKVPEVSSVVNISESQLYRLKKKAIERGWEGTKASSILLTYVQDAPRPGRPTRCTPEVLQGVDEYIENDDDTAHHQSLEELSYNVGISSSTIQRIMKKLGFNNVKITTKPGLTKAMLLKRFRWAQDHLGWTLEDFKNVVWTDECSVVLGQQRGRRRVWRKAGRGNDVKVIRVRWKSAMVFMFWACFTYDQKGPCYIYPTETAKAKQATKAWLDKLNREREPELRSQWELETGVRRIGLRNKPGRKPEWKFTPKNGLLERRGSGIDFARYIREVAEPILLPFIRERQRHRPNTVLMEDGAACHTHQYTQAFWAEHGVKKLDWPGNSPDLNAIEPVWGLIKRKSADRGPEKTRAALERRWRGEWRALPLPWLQRLVERMPDHVRKVHELEGGNNYSEGKEGDEAREDARIRAKTRRAFWRAKKQAKAAGTIDQFEAECTRRWEAARYGPEEADDEVVEAVGEASLVTRGAGSDVEDGWESDYTEASDWLDPRQFCY